MNRKDFVKSLITIPFISSFNLEDDYKIFAWGGAYKLDWVELYSYKEDKTKIFLFDSYEKSKEFFLTGPQLPDKDRSDIYLKYSAFLKKNCIEYIKKNGIKQY